jgi:uncharacterized surface protein with fasciclin (FAS1) repeats
MNYKMNSEIKNIFMMKKRNSILFFASFIAVLSVAFIFSGCNKDKEWDEHYNKTDQRLNDNLLTLLKADPDLSIFVGYLQDTGYDSLLTYSQSYTVWAPVNSAFDAVSADTLNDPDLLKVLIGNHLSRFSFATSDVGSGKSVKMYSGKYNLFTGSAGTYQLASAGLTESDILTQNGILHKVDRVVSVRRNIWDYMRFSGNFPKAIDYLDTFDIQVFDPYTSIRTGNNTLGQPIYDSSFVYSSTYFDKVGDLNSEENHFTYLGLTDAAYDKAYNYFKNFYKHPVADTTEQNTLKSIFRNLAFPPVSLQDLPGDYITNTWGNKIKIEASSVSEDVTLSNGHVFVLDTITCSAQDIIYKPVRYEVEDVRRRAIGATTAVTITKAYDLAASGNFNNIVSYILTTAPTTSNNYFEVKFSNVLSAKYDVYVKFSPSGASKDTKLTFRLVYSNFTSGTTTVNTGSTVISKTLDAPLKIGTTSTIPVFINGSTSNTYSVTFRIMFDVSIAEMVLYDRIYGIDYIDLVPVP